MVTWSIGRKEKSARNGYNIKTATRPCGYGVRIGEGSALVDQPADDIGCHGLNVGGRVGHHAVEGGVPRRPPEVLRCDI